tara:strand:+ start:523 stop:1035 length:513 start_codon:yes stop_codon:yes gene_type:complete
MKSKKGAVQLSMTTIIIIILGITLLGLGLAWISDIFGQIGDLSDQAFIQANQEIQNNMKAGQNFYVSGQTFNLEPEETKTINVGVRNILGGTSPSPITVSVTAKNPANENWIHSETKTQTIDVAPNDVQGLPIVLVVPKDITPGTTTTFTVSGSSGTTPIGTQVIVITVI